MPKMICTTCEVELRVEKNGVYVKELFKQGGVYKIWLADLWKCPRCHFMVVAGFGNHPIAEHFNPEQIARVEASIGPDDTVYLDKES